MVSTQLSHWVFLQIPLKLLDKIRLEALNWNYFITILLFTAYLLHCRFVKFLGYFAPHRIVLNRNQVNIEQFIVDFLSILQVSH